MGVARSVVVSAKMHCAHLCEVLVAGVVWWIIHHTSAARVGAHWPAMQFVRASGEGVSSSFGIWTRQATIRYPERDGCGDSKCIKFGHVSWCWPGPPRLQIGPGKLGNQCHTKRPNRPTNCSTRRSTTSSPSLPLPHGVFVSCRTLACFLESFPLRRGFGPFGNFSLR